jgi:hypothetical protein
MTWLAAAGLLACTGTDTGNPPSLLDDFQTPGCKNQGPAGEPLALVSKQRSTAEALENLECIVWQRIDEGSLSLELTNHSDNCGAELGWEPRAERDDTGALALYLDNPECSFAACGSCAYDLTFTVSLDAGADDVKVHLYGDACSQQRELERDVTVPLAGSAQGGVLCTDYRESYGLAAMFACGQSPIFGPCDDYLRESGDESCSLCGAGSLCSEVSGARKRCLPVCKVEADCADFPSTRCVAGTCQL